MHSSLAIVKVRLPAYLALVLVFVSLALFIYAAAVYLGATRLTQPNTETLSPQVVVERVVGEVMPALTASNAGAGGKVLVESLVAQATSTHELAVALARAQSRTAAVQAIAWAVVLALSVACTILLWPRRANAA
jgi:hypothetical protein